MAIVVTSTQGFEIINRLAGLGKIFNSTSLRLFRNDVVPATTDLVSNYLAANFPGYTNKTITPTRGILADGSPVLISSASWTRSTTGIAQIVYGWYWTSPTGTALIAAGRFATPRVMAMANDLVAVIFAARLGIT